MAARAQKGLSDSAAKKLVVSFGGITGPCLFVVPNSDMWRCSLHVICTPGNGEHSDDCIVIDTKKGLLKEVAEQCKLDGIAKEANIVNCRDVGCLILFPNSSGDVVRRLLNHGGALYRNLAARLGQPGGRWSKLSAAEALDERKLLLMLVLKRDAAAHALLPFGSNDVPTFAGQVLGEHVSDRDDESDDEDDDNGAALTYDNQCVAFWGNLWMYLKKAIDGKWKPYTRTIAQQPCNAHAHVCVRRRTTYRCGV
jgi:hypothetical protein